MWASAEYLKGRKLPDEPEELKALDCVMFNARNYETHWDFINGRRKVRIGVKGAVSSRDCQSVAAFVPRKSIPDFSAWQIVRAAQ